MIKRRIKLMLINKTYKEIDMSNFKRIPEDMFSGRTDIFKVELPAGVEYIGSNAFESCTSLSEVIFPDSLKGIESEAFINCINLSKAEVVTGVSVHKSAFSGCLLLEKQVI